MVGFATYKTISNKTIDVVYSDAVAPKLLCHFNSRDSQSLPALAATPVFDSRKEVLVTYVADCKHEIEFLFQQFAASSGEHAKYFAQTAKQT